MDGLAKSRNFLVVVLLSVLPGVGNALDFLAAVSLSEAYTNNVNLDPSGFEQDDWVTEVRPTIEMQQITERYQLDVDYSLQALFYGQDSARNAIYNQVDALGFVNLIDELLRIRADGELSQVNVDPEAPTTRSNLNTTGNRTDARTWEVGPELNWGLGGSLGLNAYYYAGAVDYDNPDSQDVDTQEGQAQFGSFNDATSAFGYQLVYGFRKYDFDTSGEVETQEAFARAGFYLNPDIRLTGLVGRESNLADTRNPSLDEGRWEVGLQLSFGDDLIDAGIGDRYFGTTYRFGWSRILPDRVYRLAYRESPGTTESLRIGERQNNVIDEALDFPVSEIERPGTADRTIRKRADGSVRWIFDKSEFTLLGYWEDRDPVVTTVPTVPVGGTGTSATDKSYGAGGEFRWALGIRTLASLSGSWRRRELTVSGVAQDNDLVRLRGNIDLELGLRTRMYVRAEYQVRDGVSGSLNDYDELQAGIGITRVLF